MNLQRIYWQFNWKGRNYKDASFERRQSLKCFYIEIDVSIQPPKSWWQHGRYFKIPSWQVFNHKRNFCTRNMFLKVFTNINLWLKIDLIDKSVCDYPRGIKWINFKWTIEIIYILYNFYFMLLTDFHLIVVLFSVNTLQKKNYSRLWKRIDK